MALFTVYSRGTIILLLCVLMRHLYTTRALKYNDISEHSTGSIFIFVDGVYGFMYGKDNGPWPHSNGPSNCHLNMTVTVDDTVQDTSVTVKVGFVNAVISDAGNGQTTYQTPDICSGYQPSLDERVVGVKGKLDGKMIYINETFHVLQRMTLLTTVQLCEDVSLANVGASLTGSATFENPYGYLPGTMYPKMPSYMVLFLLLCGFLSYYTLLLIRHRETALTLHLGTWVVLFIAICSSLIWFLAYKYVNKTGTPFCCPSPGIVLSALTIEVLLRAIFRCLILCVCLGYGIVYPKLSKIQTIFVILLTALFAVTGIYSAWYKTLSHGTIKQKNSADMPSFFVDSIFMVWIYISLITQLEDLHEKREMYKLEMYQKLTRTVVVALFCYITFTVLIIVSMVTEPTWMWSWIWVVEAAQTIISTCLLIAVSIIWRPSSTSNMLSWSKQIPLNEEDASVDDDSWTVGRDGGVEEFELEMGRAFAILGEEDDDASEVDVAYDDNSVDTSKDKLELDDDTHIRNLASPTNKQQRPEPFFDAND